MKRVHASDFPTLRKVFSGYLHEDFLEDYDSPAAALQAFDADADQHERHRFREETARFLAVTSSVDFADVLSLLSRLGSRWTPPTREALVALLTGAARG